MVNGLIQECMETLTNTSLPDSKYCNTTVITCMIQHAYSVCHSMMLFQAEFKANLSLPVDSPTHSMIQWVTTSTSCPTHMLTAHMLKLSPPTICSTSTSTQHMQVHPIQARPPNQIRAMSYTIPSRSTTAHSSTAVERKIRAISCTIPWRRITVRLNANLK